MLTFLNLVGAALRVEHALLYTLLNLATLHLIGVGLHYLVTLALGNGQGRRLALGRHVGCLVGAGLLALIQAAIFKVLQLPIVRIILK